MNVKTHKQNAITGAEIRAMSDRIEALMSRAMKDELTASSVERRATIIGALAEAIKTSACALGVLSGTGSPEAAMSVLEGMHRLLCGLDETTVESMEELADVLGVKLEAFDPREQDEHSYSH